LSTYKNQISVYRVGAFGVGKRIAESADFSGELEKKVDSLNEYAKKRLVPFTR
jgi:hypothetical protein